MATLESILEEIDNYAHKKIAEVQIEFVQKKIVMMNNAERSKAETFGYGVHEAQEEKDFRVEINKRDIMIAMIQEQRAANRALVIQSFEERGHF